MNIIVFLVVWMITMGLASFTVAPILIIFFFGIPFTRELNKKGVMKTNQPIKNELISVVILGTVFVAYAWLITNLTAYSWAL